MMALEEKSGAQMVSTAKGNPAFVFAEVYQSSETHPPTHQSYPD